MLQTLHEAIAIRRSVPYYVLQTRTHNLGFTTFNVRRTRKEGKIRKKEDGRNKKRWVRCRDRSKGTRRMRRIGKFRTEI
jgi:hypothetical protein